MTGTPDSPGSTGSHDEKDELVPLAEPEEHGKIRAPDIAPVPPTTIKTPTVVTERYTGSREATSTSGPRRSSGSASSPSSDSEGEELPVIVRPGFPGANPLIVGGAVLTLAAVGLAGYYSPKYPIAQALSALYDIAVHTGTGVVAVLIASMFTERRFNDPKLGAGRMYFMVAALYTVRFTPIPIPTTIDQWILGFIAYALLLLGLFRLPQRDLGIIGLTHFGLWLIVKLGASLEAFIAGAAVVSG